MPIQTQLLSAELAIQNANEGVLYKPYPLDGISSPRAAVFKPSRHQAIKQSIKAVQERVDDLLGLARLGKTRGDQGIERVAEVLSRYVIPSCGIAGLVAPEAHPQIDTATPDALSIPWEVLEERYVECPQCRGLYFSAKDKFCPRDGTPLRPRGGKLALTYQLSVINRGEDRSVAQGNRFLLITDPRGDLTDDANDPNRLCRSHVNRLYELLDGHGYEPILLDRGNARFGAIHERLRDPEVVGIYYFGHGYIAKGGEGCLVLANGDELTADDIVDAAPGARFVFLNACQGAATGVRDDWSPERGSGSIAGAFLGASALKIVIAPLFRVLNVQAAEAALAFFQAAVKGATCGEALMRIREDSWARYEKGEPELSWLAYRYFGDPNRSLPTPEILVQTLPGIPAEPQRRVFTADGLIQRDIFSFALDEMLLRAARRRIAQGGGLVGTVDLLAGLTRRGDLTRYLLLAHGQDPDQIYARLNAGTDVEFGIAADEALQDTSDTEVSSDRAGEPREIDLGDPRKVERADQLSPGLRTLLESVDHDVQMRIEQWQALHASQAGAKPHQCALAAERPSAQVCEQDLLQRLIESPDWLPLATALGLPETPVARELLNRRETEGRIDGNGTLILPPLTAGARRIVEIAHTLAQQCGTCPIPNRVMLAALLQPDASYAERCCERAGTDPVKLYMWMLAAAVAGAPEGGRHWFGLSLEAAERVLLPTLERARALAEGEIAERDLFLAYCDTADIRFKGWLKTLLHLDLDELRRIDPGQEPECITEMTPEARRIIFRAHRRAQRRGHFPIPFAAVLAAFLAEPDGLAALLLREQCLAADRVAGLLIEGLGPEAFQGYSLDATACRESVAPAVERARELAGRDNEVTETQLLQAFCETAPVSFKTELQAKLRLDLDLLGQCAASGAPPNPDLSNGQVVCTVANGGADVPPTTAPTGARSTRLGGIGVDSARLDPAVNEALASATRMAAQNAWTQVRTPHLIVAMIGDGTTPAARAFAAKGLDPAGVKEAMLQLVAPRGTPAPGTPPPALGDNVTAILGRAESVAAARGPGTLTTIQDILNALTSAAGGPVGEVLRRSGFTMESSEPLN